MTMDGTNNTVPPEAASQEQASQKTQESQQAQTSQEQQNQQDKAAQEEPLTKEKVAEMIAAAAADAAEKAKEIGRRELQSQQDKNRAELAKEQKRARLAESTLKATKETLGRLDPEAMKELELAQLRAESQTRTEEEQLVISEEQQKAYHNRFMGALTNLVTELGIDPKDPRIDWASDSKDYFEAQERVLKSVATINKDKVTQTQAEFEKRLKALEGDSKKKAEEENNEANSVNTNTSTGGVISQSDKDFMQKFGSGELPYTKANKERAEKIQSSY